jgi:hypothetical protein
MSDQLIEKLYVRLKEDLEVIAQNEKDLLKRMTAAVSKISSALQILKEHLDDHPFSSIVEEIHFFKHIKPKFYALRIYHVELYNIDNTKPYGSSKTLKKYFEDELNAVLRFFRQNQFLYEYYRQGMVELDSQYFVRGAEVEVGLFHEIPVLHPEFSTSCDYLFSKFIAYELISQELISRIKSCSNTLPVSPDQSPEEKQKLTWTGDKVNIAELAYGLYYTGQINGGTCDVADIIHWLEGSLNLQMGSVHRKFIDIRRRKTISYTKFLDQMREAIHKRVEEDLVYKPNRGIKLQNPLSGRNEGGQK